MKIPSRIQIKKGVYYEVVWTDLVDNNPDLEGLCRDRKEKRQRQILILKGLSPKRAWKVFLHEVMHAIEFEFDLPISHKLIEKLENPIFQILKLNGLIK